MLVGYIFMQFFFSKGTFNINIDTLWGRAEWWQAANKVSSTQPQYHIWMSAAGTGGALHDMVCE